MAHRIGSLDIDSCEREVIPAGDGKDEQKRYVKERLTSAALNMSIRNERFSPDLSLD
jgi:hypothetical protein